MAQSRIDLILRNAAFYAAAGIVSAPFVLAAPLVVFAFDRFGMPIIRAYLRSILFLLKWICGLDYVVSGHGNLPSGPALIASAHQSTWENLFFIVIFDNPAFVVKEELLNYPLVGSIVRKNGYLPAYRTGDLEKIKQSFEAARREAESGRSILIYPTGTRTGTDAMPELKRGVAALYQTLGLPCVPVAHDSGRYWQHKSWLRHKGTIRVDILPALAPALEKREFLTTLAERLRSTTDAMRSPTRADMAAGETVRPTRDAVL